MKRLLQTLCILLIALCVCAAATASANLEAAWSGGRIVVRWPASCQGSAVLTVYRDGWPVLATNVDCSAGQYSVPDAYTHAGGRYAVRLRTAEGCTRVDVVDNAGKAPTEAPAITQAPADTQVPAITSTPAISASPTTAPTPTPRPTATPAASGSTSSDLAAQVVSQVNDERAKQGLNALRVDAELTRAACVRAQEIVQSFSHTRPDGSSWSSVSASAYGENIAMGQRSADKVMAAWMSSSGHRANILRASYGSIGVCAYRVNGILYWVQLFGK